MTILLIITSGIVLIYLVIKLVSKKSEYPPTIKNEGKNTPEVNIKSLLKRANEKGIIKDFKSAVAITDKIILLYPSNYDALVIRANSLGALNFNLEAIDDYEKALSIDNSDPNIIGLLGLTYHIVGEFEKGQEKLKLSIQMGYKLYEMNYNMKLKMPDSVKSMLVERSKKPENLVRRNPSDFVDNLSETDHIEFKRALKNHLPTLQHSLSLDPNNTKLKELYEFTLTYLD
ncbi:MAG: hypothetical protein Q8M15_14390 [Bacteroidota bacterium]|nr:hypothetical protein [Bacteroidota bacterium]